MNVLPQIDEKVEMDSLGYSEAIYDYKTWQVVTEYIPNELVNKFSEQFRMFDRRDSGVIKIEDVSSILQNMERQVSTDQIKAILEDLIGEQAMPYSTNYVDFKEYLSVLSVLMTECISDEEMYNVFCLIDRDGDGYISSKELGELLVRMGDNIAEDKATEMILEADLDGDGKVSYPEFVCLLTNSERQLNTPSTFSVPDRAATANHSDGELNTSLEKALHSEAEISAGEDDDKEDLVCHIPIFIEEASDMETEMKPSDNQNISPKPQLRRMRSLSVGSRPTVRLEIPRARHHRKKSISELLHLTSSSKKNECRRCSVAACPPVVNHDHHYDHPRRRFSTSGLHLKQLFKKHNHHE